MRLFMPINSSQQTGSSLIEVLITLLIFTIGMLGLAALQLNALQGSSDSAQRSQSTWILQDIAERVRANPAGTAAQYAAAPNCANAPANRCADYYDPATSAKVTATNCTAAEMATFDRWEAQCSYADLASNTINARFTSRDFVTAPDNNITLSAVAAGNTLTLQGFWLGRAGKNNFASGIPAFEVRR
jgi:type IV pilus assembly protein PilV